MKLRKSFYTSYKTHNFCRNCDDGHKSGWILKEECPGMYCPNCSRKIRTKPRFNKNYDGGRY
tara:strand:+ start:2365 stop:2550 length:186 start_codon:yes stop_codon:yes gene_type:complete